MPQPYVPYADTYAEPYDDRYSDRSDRYDRRDRHDRHGRAVQPYYPADRRQRAVQPYHSDSPRRPVVRRRSDSYLDSSPPRRNKGEQAQGWLKDHGAEAIGAAVGGYAGHKKGDDHLTTVSGAAVGGIAGKIIEYQYQKWNDKRQDKKVGHQMRHGSPYSSEEDDYYEPRYRSESRRRPRSESRGRRESPGGWKDIGRTIKRELSRKREKSRARSEYSDYSR